MIIVSTICIVTVVFYTSIHAINQTLNCFHSNENTLRLPASFEIPRFPKNLQLKLDNKEPCHKNPRDRHTIIRVLYEAVAQYTM